ncbi:tape measure protein [Mediterraneibacter gnavus]|uniref:Tape measure protein n=1 Tax=Mediterraneibacter gnavus TaxID=33038 RepID=A0AAJ3FG10_MEDGN|nr:tape measure protein [Mediterraneibacter gnavus]NSC84550.1 tape measure protein [Mediterraneibacter gnavus]NSI27438.1 tape measure protein [Mediterraneibacter gnavus]NSI30917.1 tape measure protein [Mediterraneibacter gnavus]NSI46853.1 tape measure protein [Mediterraneibacter gnavus]NSI50280.1 tape measure protein [Mediterraneibacter gnavus]
MAESFSVKAILSAQDKGFKSVFGAATKSAKELKSTLMGGIGFGAMMAIGQKAVSVVSGSLSGLTKETINTSDAMQKLQQAMRFSGYAEDEIQRIAGATGTLKTYADKTVFSLQDVMSTFGSLSANGVKDAEKLTESVGNAVAVFGGGAQEFSSVALAFSQAMASGALHAQDWNQIVNASPQLAGGLRKELIKLNPVLGEDFKQAMEDGAITADLLGQAMNNIGMTDMAREAAQSVTTFEGAMGNLEATVTSGMQSIYDSFVKGKAVDAINQFNGKVESVFSRLQTWIPATMIRLGSYWKILKREASQVSGAFGDAFGAIRKELGKLIPAFGSTESVNGFRDAIQGAGDALQAFAGFLEEHADIIARVIAELPKLIVAYKGFKIAKSVAPFVGAFTSAIAGLAGKGISKIAGKLFGISKGQKEVGVSSRENVKSTMESAKAFMMLGAGVALISAGFFLLSQGAKAVADSGPLAVAVLVGMVAAIAGLLIVAKMVAPTLSSGAAGFVAFGAAVLLAAAGIAVLTMSAISLANAGPLAIAVMFGLIVAIGGLMVVAAAVAPVLTAGAVGLIAFGVAAALVGAAVLLASAGLAIVASVLPIVAEYGLQASVAIGALGVAMTVFGAGVIVAGAGCAVLAVGLLAVGVAVLGVTVGVVAFGVAMVAACVGVLAMAVALLAVNSSMKSIAKNAKTAQKSITSMKDSVSIVNDGLDALGNKAKSAVKSIVSAFDNGAGKAKSSGKKLGDSAKDGVQSGLQPTQAIAISMVSAVLASLASGAGSAYSSGLNIGISFANGLAASLGRIQAIAAQMTAAANSAAASRASLPKTRSVIAGEIENTPMISAYGMVDEINDRIDIPVISSADPVMTAYTSRVGAKKELSDDYTYKRNATYTIVVPVEYNGREAARVTAEFTQKELESRESMKMRLKGERSHV